MMNNIQAQNATRILGRVLAREITPEEANLISGGLSANTQTCIVHGLSGTITTDDKVD